MFIKPVKEKTHLNNLKLLIFDLFPKYLNQQKKVSEFHFNKYEYN